MCSAIIMLCHVHFTRPYLAGWALARTRTLETRFLTMRQIYLTRRLLRVYPNSVVGDNRRCLRVHFELKRQKIGLTDSATNLMTEAKGAWSGTLILCGWQCRRILRAKRSLRVRRKRDFEGDLVLGRRFLGLLVLVRLHYCERFLKFIVSWMILGI